MYVLCRLYHRQCLSNAPEQIFIVDILSGYTFHPARLWTIATIGTKQNLIKIVISNRRQFDPKKNFNFDILSAREYTVYLILMFKRQSQKIINRRKLLLSWVVECAHIYIILFNFESLMIDWGSFSLQIMGNAIKKKIL